MKGYKQIIHNYWQSQEFGRRMIASGNVSDSDLLFLIPNNKKRRLGLPLTRIPSKKKKIYKRRRKHHILTFYCFDIVEEMLNARLQEAFLQNEYFNKFISVKDVDIGRDDQDVFSI